jgi:hypothetical protein
MKPVRGISFLLLASLVIMRCGGNSGGGNNPPVTDPQPRPTSTPTPSPTVGSHQFVLTLFAGEPCHSCNTELPQIRDRLKTELGEKAALVKVRVYVVAAKDWKKADEATARAYGEKLSLPFEMLVDDHCETHYFGYFPENEKCLVPAALIQKPDNSTVIAYKTGSLSVDTLMAKLKSLVQ